MLISKKGQYGLKAVFELAWRNTHKPVKISDIAASQDVPSRFLEVILSELRHGGFVESRRGKEGGYLLGKGPEDITVGQILEYLQGPVSLGAENIEGSSHGNASLGELWNQLSGSITSVLGSVTLADLVAREKKLDENYVPNYTI